jgi:hypothetical protein
MVLLVSSDCSYDPFDVRPEPGVLVLVARVWDMFPRKVLDSDDPEEWGKYLEFPCKTKVFRRRSCGRQIARCTASVASLVVGLHLWRH